MTSDDLHDTMTLLGIHWPGTMTAPELDAYRRALHPMDAGMAQATLDGLAHGGSYPRFRPTIAVIVETYRAFQRRSTAPWQPDEPEGPLATLDAHQAGLAACREQLTKATVR